MTITIASKDADGNIVCIHEWEATPGAIAALEGFLQSERAALMPLKKRLYET